MIIYKITNKFNDIIYIGQTKQSLQARWSYHCYSAKKRYYYGKLKDAIQEFGAENFTVEQIDCAATKEEANEKEVYWIKFYGSVENGYNTSPGGNNSGKGKKVMAVEDGLVFDTMIEAAKHYGLSISMIPQVVDKPHLKAAGQHWKSVKQ